MEFKEEVQGVMSIVEKSTKLTLLEEQLHQALVEEIDANRSRDANMSEAYNAILRYLEGHRKLLKDAVYPHLCSEIDGMNG